MEQATRKWAVWMHMGPNSPITYFDDRDLAQKAAERLAAQFPGSDVHLMATVYLCRFVNVQPLQWRQCS